VTFACAFLSHNKIYLVKKVISIHFITLLFSSDGGF